MLHLLSSFSRILNLVFNIYLLHGKQFRFEKFSNFVNLRVRPKDMESEDTQAQIARRHDLTGTIAQFLDPHMFLMVLESHSSGSIPIYERRSLLKE